MNKKQQPADWQEGRRLRGWDLYEQGWQQKDIATALGVTEGAVSQWISRGKAGGREALRNRPRSGAPRRLSDEQLAQLPQLLKRGAEAYGFIGAVWTQERVATMIAREFGVRYHPDHVGRLLHKIGWSVQKPQERADQRNDEAIAQWRVEQWPAIKAKAQQERRTLVWIDEAGFYLLPALVRTWAPIGETPLLRAPCSYDRLSVISALTPSGRLFFQVYDHSIRGPQVKAFLVHLLQHIPGKLLVLWDGASIHRSKVVKEFLGHGEGARIHLEQLPGYAPDLNPDEGIWGYLKYHELRNVVCKDRRTLRKALRRATARLRHKKHVIAGCFKQAGIEV